MNWVGKGDRSYFIDAGDLLKQHAYLQGITGIDDLLNAYVQTACEIIEGYIGYPLTYATAEIFVSLRPGEHTIMIPKAATVTTISLLVDSAWTAQTFTGPRTDEKKRYSTYSHEDLASGDYKLAIALNPVISHTMKHCARLLVAEMYEQRESKEFKAPMTTVERILHNESLY
jgi:hypothetical protein